jgi:hypothetical protein
MKVVLSLLLLASGLLNSCGALRVTPKGCNTQGVWGEDLAENRQDKQVKQESIIKESFTVFFNVQEVELGPFLKEKGIECSEIKKMSIQLTSDFFIMREMIITIKK